jgi:metal-dependent HD superfamily phosphatase/phosphodiesterase
MNYFIVSYRGTRNNVSIAGDMTIKANIYPNREVMENFLEEEEFITDFIVVNIMKVSRRQYNAFNETEDDK